MDFSKYNIDKSLSDVLAKHGYVQMTAVQDAVIPLALKGESLIVKAQTGSGKTHSFLVPLFARLNKHDGIQAIILAPTRELARQIYTFSMEINHDYNEIDILLLAGGIEKSRAKGRLSNKPNLIIATPGRFKDLLVDDDVTSLKSVHTLILDEGDMLLDAGFYGIISEVIDYIEPTTIQLFSATIPQKLANLVTMKTGVKKVIDVHKNAQTSNTVTHYVIDVHHLDRNAVALAFITKYNPYLLLIFGSTNKEVLELYEYLSAQGLKVGLLSGELESRKRKAMFRRVQNNEFQVIVASDIAARGIDIPNISHVLSLSFPYDLEFYFHRAGRTGRNYATGEAFTMFDHDDMARIDKIATAGISFINLVYKDGEFNKVSAKSRKEKVLTPQEKALDVQIKKAVATTKTKKVRPRYKKKVQEAVDKVKRQHKRKLIKESLKEQRMKTKKGD